MVLRKRAKPKAWIRQLRPSDLEASRVQPASEPGSGACRAEDVREGASPAAVQPHYDISNDFYALWLGPSMMYTSGLWTSDADDPGDLDAATRRKIDFFADHVIRAPGAELLDVGCGWGGNQRRLVETHKVGRAVGLTLSAAQCDFVTAQPIGATDIRLENWADHEPHRPYDAIVAYGAFEHFARDGTNGVQRVNAYRKFFASCFKWLKPDGRLGLETIAHDGAPDTAAPLGRGPLGDVVLSIFPESICPHLMK